MSDDYTHGDNLSDPWGDASDLYVSDKSYKEMQDEIERLTFCYVNHLQGIENLQYRIENLNRDVDGLMTLLAKEKADNERLRKQNQIATQALFDICQSDWGIGHSMARPAHKAIKEMAALKGAK